jgi:hypothetical protein
VLKDLLTREIGRSGRIHPKRLGAQELEKRAAEGFAALAGEEAIRRMENFLVWLSHGPAIPNRTEVPVLDHELWSFGFDGKLAVTEEDAFTRAGGKIRGVPEGMRDSLPTEPFGHGHRMNVYGM